MALHEILQNTVDSREDGEVAFMHIYTSNIMPSVRAANANVLDPLLGGTFSLSMEKLQLILCMDSSAEVESAFTLERSPHRFASVVVSSASSGNRPADGVLQEFNPERAPETAGKLVMHFFKKSRADEFVSLVRQFDNMV